MRMRSGGSLPGKARALAFAFVVAAIATPASAVEPIAVVVDKATLVKLPERVTTIVVGNPLIADVTVQSGGMIVITGKGYGTTNVVALDRSGAVLMERTIQVTGVRDNAVVVYRGVERETYSCTPNCQRRVVLGDSPPYFTATLGQTSVRNAQAATASQGQPR